MNLKGVKAVAVRQMWRVNTTECKETLVRKMNSTDLCHVTRVNAVYLNSVLLEFFGIVQKCIYVFSKFPWPLRHGYEQSMGIS
jgi:hypothetical protein